MPIAYRFQKPKENKPTFVWFGGFKSEMASVKASALANWARENGAGCLRFDYSGHGKSGGRFEDGTISAWLGQAAAVCAHALQEAPRCSWGRAWAAGSPFSWRGSLRKSPLTLSLSPHSPRGERTLELSSTRILGPFSPRGEGQDEGGLGIQSQRHRAYRASLGHDAPVLGARDGGNSRRHRARRRLLPPLRLWRWALRHHQGADRGWRTPPLSAPAPSRSPYPSAFFTAAKTPTFHGGTRSRCSTPPPAPICASRSSRTASIACRARKTSPCSSPRSRNSCRFPVCSGHKPRVSIRAYYKTMRFTGLLTAAAR